MNSSQFMVGDEVKWCRTSSTGEVTTVIEVKPDGIIVKSGEFWEEGMFVSNERLDEGFIRKLTPLEKAMF